MKALENRTVDAKREMDILDALQDIRARNARNDRVGQSVDLVANASPEELETEEDRQRRLAEEEDEKIVRQVFAKVPLSTSQGPSSIPSNSSGGAGSDPVSHTIIKRKADDIEPDIHTLLAASMAPTGAKASTDSVKKPRTNFKNKLGIKIMKKGKVVV